jgi:membrane dipeptidase
VPGVETSLRDDPAGWARRLGVSREAIELHLASGAVDLHVESFIWTRVFRYDLARAHERSLLGGRLYGQVDLPRLHDAGVGGAVMSIATNPFRPFSSRRRATRINVARLRRLLESFPETTVVEDAAAFDRARAEGKLACLLALQGANALAPEDLTSPSLAALSRITLVHLTRSRYGSVSAPGGRRGGLQPRGRRMIEAMREQRVLLDLAHASPRTFWDAIDVNGDAPVIVSHTGVRAVRESWRNVDDAQIRAVAARGGVVGVMVHAGYLASPARRASVADIVRHIDHVVRIGGDEAAALGTDYDGFIVPPRDVRSVVALPRLTQAMLDAGYSPERIVRVLATNAIRPLRMLRAGAPEKNADGQV